MLAAAGDEVVEHQRRDVAGADLVDKAAPQLVAFGGRQEALEPVVPLDLVAVPAGQPQQEGVAVRDPADRVEEHRRQLHVLDEDPEVLGVLQRGEQLAAAFGAGGLGHGGWR